MATWTYGSHPGRLDQLMASLGPDERASVRMLGAAENADLEDVSLNRFPQSSWGAIRWDGLEILAQVEVLDTGDIERTLLEWLLLHAAPNSKVVIFWGNLIVPSLEMTAQVAGNHMSEILAATHDLWIFVVREGVLIEFHHEGKLTAARIPSSDGDTTVGR
jgi:hypothetical protein